MTLFQGSTRYFDSAGSGKFLAYGESDRAGFEHWVSVSWLEWNMNGTQWLQLH